MTALTTAICVWLDTTSDYSDPRWIVSLDRLNDSGQAVTTRTLDVCDAEPEALATGRREAAARGLPLYRNPEDGPAVPVDQCD